MNLLSNSLSSQSPSLGFPNFESRVNALDAERLYEELLQLLECQVTSCMSLFNIESIPKPELSFVLRLLIYFSSTYRHRPTPSDAMFNIKMSSIMHPKINSVSTLTASSSKTPVFLSSLLLKQSHQYLSSKQKWGYLALLIVGPWLATRLKGFIERSYKDYHARKQQLEMHCVFRDARASSRKIVKNTVQHSSHNKDVPMPPLAKLHTPISIFSSIYEILTFANFLVFLIEGRHRSFEERCLGIEVSSITSTARRQLDFTYLRHHIYWHTVTEFLLAVAPSLDIDAFMGLTRALIRWVIKQVNSKLNCSNQCLELIQEGLTREAPVNLHLSFRAKLLTVFIQLLFSAKQCLNAVCLRLTDPTTLDLRNEKKESTVLSNPGRFSGLWYRYHLIQELLTRLDMKPCSPKYYHDNGNSTKGKSLEKWFRNPTSVTCKFCGICPITVPSVGSCECLMPFCYLCLRMRQNHGPVLCSYCGVFMYETRVVGANDIYRIKS